jgi:hypothetical protein
MLEQLTHAQQFGVESVVKNNAIPNEQNEAVIEEAGSSIFLVYRKLQQKAV